MISRRRFLEIGGATAGAVAASRPLVIPAAAQATDSSLAPAIAQLKSRKSEAAPITTEERGHRQERARKLMAENALDAIIVMAGTTLRYFTGISWWGSERMFALILPAKGTPFYVCPGFEEARAREQLRNAPEGTNAEVRVWQENENSYRLVSQCLKDRRWLREESAWKKRYVSSFPMASRKPLPKPFSPARLRSPPAAA
jgi:Xaa-Pro dipeptidase